MEKAALVTGSSRGIGKAIACRLAQSMPVILNCRADLDAALGVQEEIERGGGKALVRKADVSDYEQVRDLYASVRDAGYWVHALVNNAGIVNDQIAAMMTVGSWKQVIDCNLNGSFYCIKEAVQEMIPRRSGVIVNLSSMSGLHGQAGQANYSASKAGLIGLTKCLAKELGRYRIRVNCVAPGYIETDMLAEVLGNDRMKTRIELARKELIPLGRLGNPVDVAEVVEFLVSRRSSYMTGQTLEVDGGLGI